MEVVSGHVIDQPFHHPAYLVWTEMLQSRHWRQAASSPMVSWHTAHFTLDNERFR